MKNGEFDHAFLISRYGSQSSILMDCELHAKLWKLAVKDQYSLLRMIFVVKCQQLQSILMAVAIPFRT